MIPTISQICSLPSAFESDLADYAAGTCASVELWLGKLDTYLETHPADNIRKLLNLHGLQAPVASFQGGLLASQGEARAEHWSSFGRRLELCREIGVHTLVLLADVHGAIQQQDIDRVRHSLAQAAKQAEQTGVRLALEFQGKASLGNNLESAAALVAEVESPYLGICFDVFHYYQGPSKLDDLAWLTSDNLFHVQLCDLAGVPRELATDGDRILPGDGDFQLAPILEHFKAIGYAGCVSVELMNPIIWQVPARQFGEVAMTALRRLLG